MVTLALNVAPKHFRNSLQVDSGGGGLLGAERGPPAMCRHSRDCITQAAVWTEAPEHSQPPLPVSPVPPTGQPPLLLQLPRAEPSTGSPHGPRRQHQQAHRSHGVLGKKPYPRVSVLLFS